MITVERMHLQRGVFTVMNLEADFLLQKVYCNSFKFCVVLSTY